MSGKLKCMLKWKLSACISELINEVCPRHLVSSLEDESLTRNMCNTFVCSSLPNFHFFDFRCSVPVSSFTHLSLPSSSSFSSSSFLFALLLLLQSFVNYVIISYSKHLLFSKSLFNRKESPLPPLFTRTRSFGDLLVIPLLHSLSVESFLSVSLQQFLKEKCARHIVRGEKGRGKCSSSVRLHTTPTN